MDKIKKGEKIFYEAAKHYNLATESYGTSNYKLNHKKAFAKFKEAAKLNHPLSIVYVGTYYEEGLVVPYSIEKAIKYYKKGMELNSKYAFERMGSLYHEGMGVKQSNLKAYKLYKRAKTKFAKFNMDILETYFYDEIKEEIENEM